MITIFKNGEIGLLTQGEPSGRRRLHFSGPTSEDVSQLQALGFQHDFLTYPLDLDEQAHTEREDGEILIVLRIPYYQGENVDVPYTTLPLGIILTDRLIITVCKHDNEILQGFASGRMRDLSTTKRNRFILRMLLKSAQVYLAHLKEINKIVDALEDQLQLSTRNKEVMELLKYQKSLTHFTTALKST